MSSFSRLSKFPAYMYTGKQLLRRQTSLVSANGSNGNHDRSCKYSQAVHLDDSLEVLMEKDKKKKKKKHVKSKKKKEADLSLKDTTLTLLDTNKLQVTRLEDLPGLRGTYKKKILPQMSNVTPGSDKTFSSVSLYPSEEEGKTQKITDIKDYLNEQESSGDATEQEGTLRTEDTLLESQDVLKREFAFLSFLCIQGKTRTAFKIIEKNLKCPEVLMSLYSKEKYVNAKFNMFVESLMQKYSHMGMRAEMDNVISLLREQNIRLYRLNHIYYLECLARIDAPVHEIKAALDELSNQFPDFDLTAAGKYFPFVQDEWYFFRKALESVSPGIKFKPFYEQDKYSQPFLKELNVECEVKAIPSKKKPKLFSEDVAMEMVGNIDRQIENEQKFLIKFPLIRRKLDLTDEEFHEYNRIFSDLRTKWIKNMNKRFDDTLKEMKEDKEEAIFLQTMPRDFWREHLEKMLDLILMKMTETDQYPVQHAETYMGTYAYLAHKALLVKRNGMGPKFLQLYKEYVGALQKMHKSVNHRHLWQHLFNSNDDGITVDQMNAKSTWRDIIVDKVGKWLFKILKDSMVFDPNSCSMIPDQDDSSSRRAVPVIYIFYQTKFEKGSYLQVSSMKLHPTLRKLLFQVTSREKLFNVNDFPMLTPPVPWITKSLGGQGHSVSGKLVPHFGRERHYNNIEPVLDALNVLSSCPWKINKVILQHAINVYKDGGDTSLSIPLAASAYPSTQEISKKKRGKMDLEEYYRLSYAIKQQRKAMSESFSLSCTMDYQLIMANHLKDEILWFPQQMDFRGRVYPRTKILSHIGGDLTRSLFLFAHAKELGDKGLDWLKIHTINMAGLKKRDSNADRLSLANDLLPAIIQSAVTPFEGHQWWMESEDPWQTLACCIELKNAYDLSNPATYRSNLPIHQDGSCNGLQHYAALGRDVKGAKSVNLMPQDKPQDVYSDVLAIVEERRKADAKEGNVLAQRLEGFVSRKVIKQSIMTTVYGVTLYGARLQIKKKFKTLDNFPPDLYDQGSSYLAKLCFGSLEEVFTSAVHIQAWLRRLAELMSSCYVTSQWKTPLNFTVIQSYYKDTGKLKYISEADRIFNRKSFTIFIPDRNKHRNGFPPNFIHSLDSTHMMMTALFCSKAEIDFAAVHDCFWTHACDVDTMNKICREQFVALHSLDILGDLSRHLLTVLISFERTRTHLPNQKPATVEEFKRNLQLLKEHLRNVPKKGDFDLRQVLDSTYFFS